MKASEAKELASRYVIDMTRIYDLIRKSAQNGLFGTVLHIGQDFPYCVDLDKIVDILRENGYVANVVVNTTETKIVVSWK